MKVALISFITHSSHLNYGATLHGYAFQQVLSKYGIDSRVIRYIPKLLKKDNLKYPILIPKGQRSFISWFLVKINWLIGFNANLRKYKKFQEFIDKQLITTKRTYNYEDLKVCNKVDNTDFDVFICESDIIWKISDIESIDENFFLSFPAANGKAKIAYAPTVASTPLEGDVLLRFKQLTEPFQAISARESKGAEYLTKVLMRKVEFVLDPTLLLEESDYDTISVPPTDSDYLLVYNCTVNDIKMVEQAKKFAKMNNLKLIEISNYSLNRFIVRHTVLDDIGIEEWLGYFKHAKMVITNSFHGMCFSIVYKKPFFIFQRDNRDFRMQNIVDALGLTDHLVPCETRHLPLINPAINYNDVYTILSELRAKSFRFIESSLSI